MIDLRALHSMLIEMHGGMLTLATTCILVMVIRAFHQKMRGKANLYAIFSRLDGFIEKMAEYAEPASYVASIGGFTGLVVSSVIGYYAWPVEVLTESPLARNKIMMAILSTEFWAIFILIRTKYGESLWKKGRLATVYVCSGFAGFFFMVLTGSLGGHMTAVHTPGRGSVLDPIYEWLSVRPDILWIGMLPFLVVAVSILIVVFFLLRFYC